LVWTEITRAKYCRDGLRYASDTTDEEWAMIAPYMPCKNPATRDGDAGTGEFDLFHRSCPRQRPATS
jgi:transposase